MGDNRLSLIDSIEIHEIEHVVRAEYPADDSLPDFLANDVPDVDDMPDRLHLSDGRVEPVAGVQDASIDHYAGPGQFEVDLQLNETPSGCAISVLKIPA